MIGDVLDEASQILVYGKGSAVGEHNLLVDQSLDLLLLVVIDAKCQKAAMNLWLDKAPVPFIQHGQVKTVEEAIEQVRGILGRFPTDRHKLVGVLRREVDPVGQGGELAGAGVFIGQITLAGCNGFERAVDPSLLDRVHGIFQIWWIAWVRIHETRLESNRDELRLMKLLNLFSRSGASSVRFS